MILVYYYFHSLLKTINVILDLRVNVYYYFGFLRLLPMALTESSILHVSYSWAFLWNGIASFPPKAQPEWRTWDCAYRDLSTPTVCMYSSTRFYFQTVWALSCHYQSQVLLTNAGYIICAEFPVNFLKQLCPHDLPFFFFVSFKANSCIVQNF